MKWFKILIILLYIPSLYLDAGELRNKRIIDSKIPEITTDLVSQANSGDPESMYRLAIAYIHTSPEKEISEAPGLLLRAAESGHEKAMYVYAYLNRHNPALAIEWLEKSKRKGYVPAFHQLGFYYLKGAWSGWSDNKDYQKAYGNLTEAALEGSLYSQSLLAEMYFEGLGVTRNTELARVLYLDAAQKGHYDSYSDLVTKWYEEGGLTPDPDKADKYWYAYKNNKDRVWCGEDEQGIDYVCDNRHSYLYEIFYYLAEYM